MVVHFALSIVRGGQKAAEFASFFVCLAVSSRLQHNK